jgi:RNA polymerase sigma-70 factor, ECF subfamily
MADLDKDEMGLIQRVAGGDQQAFLVIYDRYSPRIYALALHMLGEPMLAEEVTQDTFIKIWNRARQYASERGSFTVWLMTVARHTALDRLRLEGRRPQLSDARDPETVWPLLHDNSHDPDEARWKSLYFAVRSLPEDQRQVIDLAYYQGMSQSEIAAELGWPLGTVKTRMRAAMQALRNEWAKGDAD